MFPVQPKIKLFHEPSLARLFADADVDLAELINKELMIGDANQHTVERVNQWQAKFSQISQRIKSNLNQAHQYEVAQRQEVRRELRNWRQRQQHSV